jgi:Ni/Fe-hydrogenase subunit HybB-like protein
VKALVNHPAFNIAVFALLLSLPWEFGQMWLYAGASHMSHLEGIQICMAATLGDAVIMLVAFAIIAAFAGSQEWVRAPKPSQTASFVLIGLAVTIAIEIIATRADGILSWRYAPAMPVTPFLGVGLAPLLMWLIVPLLVLWFVSRQIGPASIPLDS